MEFTQWVVCWTSILGPIYFLLIVALYVARHFIPDVHILFEITETIMMIFAATLSAAVAGLIVILI
jgi:hypothetical protein